MVYVPFLVFRRAAFETAFFSRGGMLFLPMGQLFEFCADGNLSVGNLIQTAPD